MRRRLWSTLPTEHSRRCAISALDISSENSATGFCSVTATCSAMLSARLVLPIDGRAARITRFDFCRPDVSRSSSPKPVGRPVTPLPSPFSNSMREPVEGLVERLLDEREVLAGAVLRDLVDLLLGHVEQLARVARPVVAELRDLGADADQAAQHRHLAHDLGVAPGVRDDGDGLGQREHGGPAADLLERAALIEPVADGDLVDGLGALIEVEHRGEDLAVPAAVEVLGLQDLGGLRDGRLGEQHRAEHRLLGVEVLRRQTPCGILPLGHADWSSPLHGAHLSRAVARRAVRRATHIRSLRRERAPARSAPRSVFGRRAGRTSSPRRARPSS